MLAIDRNQLLVTVGAHTTEGITTLGVAQHLAEQLGRLVPSKRDKLFVARSRTSPVRVLGMWANEARTLYWQTALWNPALGETPNLHEIAERHVHGKANERRKQQKLAGEAQRRHKKLIEEQEKSREWGNFLAKKTGRTNAWQRGRVGCLDEGSDAVREMQDFVKTAGRVSVIKG